MKTLLTVILATTCILIGCEYFFTTSNMIMYEMLVSALPSFVLSLQPNTKRVKGKFIPFVLSRAIPGALTMALGILSLYVVRQTGLAGTFGFVADGADTLSYHALMMVVLTFSGLVMLYRICQPFNLVRACLFILSTFLCAVVVAVPALGEFVFEGWKEIDFTLSQVLLTAIILQASFPISKGLIKFFDMINTAEE
jgi:cation-transporting ATPase E